MATDESDWRFLRDVMVSIDRKINGGPSSWDLPTIRTEAAAREYLEAVQQRLEIVEKRVEEYFTGDPIAQDIGRHVGQLVATGAKRAAKLARDVAHDMAERFDGIVASMEKGGENIATGLGIGAAVVILIGLLLLREWKAR
jgi:hypothetical protein